MYLLTPRDALAGRRKRNVDTKEMKMLFSVSASLFFQCMLFSLSMFSLFAIASLLPQFFSWLEEEKRRHEEENRRHAEQCKFEEERHQREEEERRKAEQLSEKERSQRPVAEFLLEFFKSSASIRRPFHARSIALTKILYHLDQEINTSNNLTGRHELREYVWYFSKKYPPCSI